MDDEPSAAADEAALDLLVSSADAMDASAAGTCPEANILAALADGTIDAGARAQTESHISRCSPCRSIAAIAVVDAGRAPSFGLGDEEEGRDRPGLPRAFGPYTLVRRLGGGGMGDVFEAEHAGRRRREALKQLRAGLDGDERSTERFLREIRAVAAIAHEHVVPLYDSGSIEGVPYFTMPLLPGPSFAEIVDEIRRAGGPLARAGSEVLDHYGVAAAPAPVADVDVSYTRRLAAAFAGVADALAAIHTAGMVHRDVKPSNVVLDEQRRAVLTDFGLARIDASRITRASEAVGTPAYMAPEQLVPSATVDGRADVYALGATLFELATLTRVVEGGTLEQTVAAILRGDVRSARALNPHLPRDFDVIVARCLERRPADRYADARSLARDLVAFSLGDPIVARPPSPAARLSRAVGRHKLPVMAAATLLAVAGAFVWPRPGVLSVRAVPVARVSLDGEDEGVTPLVHRSVAAGMHRIALSHEKFAPLLRTVDIGRGATYDVDVVLRALDPADPETLTLLASALDIARAEVKVDLDRAPSSGEPVVLLPRGALREPPSDVSFWADTPVADVAVRLVRADDAAPVHTWTVAKAFQQTRLDVPAEVRARLGPGAYRLEMTAGGRTARGASFEVLADADAKRIGDALGELTRRFDSDDPTAGFLRAEKLVGERLYVEALAEASRLRQDVGDRREIARLVLAALDGAGLRGFEPWFEWGELYLRAER